MRHLKTLAWVFVFALIATMMAACAKSGGGDAYSPPPDAIPTQTIPMGTQVGFFAQNQLMTSYNGNVQGTTYNTASTEKMTLILKNIMGVCDRNHSDGGLSACSSWLGGFQDIMVFANGSQAGSVKLVLRAFPYQSGNSSYYYSLPSFRQFLLGALGFNTINMAAMYNPLVLNASINPINKSLGFELRANAPAGATYQGGVNNLIHFSVDQGKLEDAGWDYKLYLNYDPVNQLVATGHAARCQVQNCGVQGF